MSFRGTFEWYNSLHQGGKRAISFTLTCKNMFKTETFDCAIIDSTGQQPTQVRRQLKLKPNEALIFNYDRCRWDWCQGDYFCILGKGDKVEQRWDLNLKIYARGECPECHGSHRCYNCNGSGVIRIQHAHTVDTCQTCNGTGICQKCYVPIRSGSTLAQEVYGAQPLPNSELSKQRKIVALQQTISDLEGTWNWGIIKKHVEKCCKYYCRLGHHTFDEGRILRSYELQTTSNKRSNAIRLFVDQIESDLTGARWYIHEKWNEREHADNFSSMQKSYLKNVIEDIVKTKHPSLKDNKTISNSVFSILSGEYIFNFPFNEEKYWKDKEHSLPDCIIDVVNRYAKTCMKLYISSFLFTESIREHITDEEQKSLDTIIIEDLCQALVNAQLNFVRNKLLGKETDKSGNHNQHNSGSHSSDYEDDYRTDPTTSWIYQP